MRIGISLFAAVALLGLAACATDGQPQPGGSPQAGSGVVTSGPDRGKKAGSAAIGAGGGEAAPKEDKSLKRDLDPSLDQQRRAATRAAR